MESQEPEGTFYAGDVVTMVGFGNSFSEKVVGLMARSGNMGRTTVLARLYVAGGNSMTGRTYPVPRAITYGALVMSQYRVRYTLGRLGPRQIAEAPVNGR